MLHSSSRNLKSETLTILKKYNKSHFDIKWVGCRSFKIPIEEFWELADRMYDAGYGGQEVAEDLLVVGENWWLERHEYDGAEWWEYKELPKEPETIISIPTLFPTEDTDYEYMFLKDFNKNGNYDN